MKIYHKPHETHIQKSNLRITVELIGIGVSILLSLFYLFQFIETTLDISIIQNGGLPFMSLIVLTSISLSLCYALIRYPRFISEIDNETIQPKEENVLLSLVESIESAFSEKKWKEVIRIGSVLSRPLWVAGHYFMRIKIGEYVEAAAAFSGDKRTQIRALIDDLGWTNLIIGDEKKANEHIKHGIEIADEIEDHYMVSKGYRHLSGIALKQKDINNAIINHENAKKELENIIDEKKRKELEAGLFVNTALIEMERNNWQGALSELKNAKEIYKQMEDEEREVKMYPMIGNCLAGLNDFVGALDAFRKGLTAAETQSRKDSIISNLQGIGRVYTKQEEFNKAKEYYIAALNLSKEIQDKSKSLEIEEELSRIKKIQGSE